MNSIGKESIYEILKDDIHRCNVVLDIGCGELAHQNVMMNTLNDLFSFDESEATKIWGIDANPPELVLCKIMYRQYMLKKHGLLLSDHSRDQEFINRFNERYVVEEGDINSWICDENSVSVIVCDFLLHFFPHAEHAPLIRKMMTFLEPGGLLYLRMNATTHININTSTTVERLGNNTFKEAGINYPARTFYLTTPETLLSQISEFHVLTKYSVVTDNNFTVVFRK